MRHFPAVVGVLCLLAVPAAATEEVLDLEKAIDLALQNNPFLKSVEERRNQVEAGVREAWADVYPQVSFRGGWNRSRNPSLLNSADFEDLIELFPDYSPQQQDLYNLGFELEQPLYKAGKIDLSLEGMKKLLAHHAPDPGSVCRHSLDHGLCTQSARIMIPQQKKLLISDGPPCTSPFQEFTLEG